MKMTRFNAGARERAELQAERDRRAGRAPQLEPVKNTDDCTHRQPRRGDYVTLKARVSPELAQRVEQLAQLAGMSQSRYLSELIHNATGIVWQTKL